MIPKASFFLQKKLKVFRDCDFFSNFVFNIGRQ